MHGKESAKEIDMDHKGINETIVHLKNELSKLEEEARILKGIINNLQLEVGINPEYAKAETKAF